MESPKKKIRILGLLGKFLSVGAPIDGWLISERRIAALPKRQRFGESVEFLGPFLKKEVASLIWGRQNEANITKLYSLRNVPVHLLHQVGSYPHRGLRRRRHIDVTE